MFPLNLATLSDILMLFACLSTVRCTVLVEAYFEESMVPVWVETLLKVA